MKRILIAGGSGLIGHRLSELLSAKGYIVSHLSRTEKKNSIYQTFLWHIEKGMIDTDAIVNQDVIINLSGEAISKRWTIKQKEEITNSRIESVALLRETIKKTPNHIEAFISASGTGYYGHRPNETLYEADAPANDFLGTTCQLWEAEVQKISELNIRTCCIRTGLVLAKEGGALPQMSNPVRMGLGATLGNGKQWMSWIHIDDLCGIYIKAAEDKMMNGPYNAVAPHPVTNKEFTQTLAKVLHKPLWLPPAPAFILRLIFGEMASVLFDSAKVSADKIISAGYEFKYNELDKALKSLSLINGH